MHTQALSPVHFLHHVLHSFIFFIMVIWYPTVVFQHFSKSDKRSWLTRQGFSNFWSYEAHEEIDHNLRSPTIKYVSILISKRIARRALGLRTEHFENLWTRWPPWPFTNPMWHSAPLCLHWSDIVPLFSFALIFANGWFTSCDGFYGASACWLSHMKQQTINHHQHCCAIITNR